MPKRLITPQPIFDQAEVRRLLTSISLMTLVAAVLLSSFNLLYFNGLVRPTPVIAGAMAALSLVLLRCRHVLAASMLMTFGVAAAGWVGVYLAGSITSVTLFIIPLAVLMSIVLLGRRLAVLLVLAHALLAFYFFDAQNNLRLVANPPPLENTLVVILVMPLLAYAMGHYFLASYAKKLNDVRVAQALLADERDHLDDMVRKRTHELSLAKEAAEKASRVKSEFLTAMSHELRTPLNAVLGFSQLLSHDPKLTPVQHDHVQEIYAGGKHLLALVSDVLDLSKIESQQMSVKLGQLALAPLVQDCVQLLQAFADKRQIVLSVDLQDHLHLTADPTRLRQVLLNLMSNAIKYNRPGGFVRVSARQHEGKTVQIDVVDNGRGIAEDTRAHVFEAFHRGAADRDAVEGTGVGLTITQKLVHLMHGEIGFESTSGLGSRFWVSLPGQTLATTTSPEAPDASAAIAPTPATLHQHTVVCVDDNLANLHLLEHILNTRADLRVLTASSAQEGITLITQEVPDLVLLDIAMPHMSGFEVLAHLRTLPALNNTPIMAVSANAMPEDLAQGQAAGFAAYITKPIDVPALLAEVNRLLPA
jgi:signal transduction histidine kinase